MAPKPYKPPPYMDAMDYAVCVGDALAYMLEVPAPSDLEQSTPTAELPPLRSARVTRTRLITTQYGLTFVSSINLISSNPNHK